MHATEDRLDAFLVEIDALRSRLAAAESRATALAGQLARMRTALEGMLPHLVHQHDCLANTYGGEDCDCGMRRIHAAAIAALSTPTEPT